MKNCGNLIFILFIFFAAVSSTPANADPSCLLPLLQILTPEFSNAYESTLGIDPALIRGEKTPAWKDFETLKTIVKNVQEGKHSVIAARKLKQLKEVITELEKSENLDPKISSLRHASESANLSDHYQPTEYELKLEYQNILWSLNRELPEKLRIPGVKLPVDTRLPLLVEDAKRLLHDQEVRFQKQLRNSGYRSLKEFNAALVDHSATAKSLQQIFENEDFELAMNRPENARWWSPRVGFQNQRVTGTSKGSFDIPHRNDVEASMMGIPLSTYAPFDDQLKPNYGYLKPKFDGAYVQARDAEHYGSDVYTFKKDKVRDRLTWTAGDSFGPASYAKGGKNNGPLNWRGNFIPWKYRDLIVPDVMETIESKNTAFTASAPIFQPKLKNPDPGEFKIPLEEQPAPPVVPTFGLRAPESPPMPVFSGFPSYPIDPNAKNYLFIEPPKLTRLKPGQKFDEAMTEMQNSKKYKNYLKKQAEQQEQSLKFQNSEAVKTYQLEVKKAQLVWGERVAAFYQTPEYLKYATDYTEYAAKQTEFQKTPVYLQYNEDIQKFQTQTSEIQSRNAAKLAEALKTPDGLAYQEKKRLHDEELAAYRASDPGKWSEYQAGFDMYLALRDTSLHKFKSPGMNGYIELQYWGPVGLNEVEAFEFRGNPPDGEFLNELQRRGIKIRDGRVQPAVAWQAGEK